VQRQLETRSTCQMRHVISVVITLTGIAMIQWEALNRIKYLVALLPSSELVSYFARYESRSFFIAAMRHPWLSLAIFVAFLFTYVIASPLPSGRGGETRSGKSCASNHDALGEHSAPGNGGHGGTVGGQNSMSNVRAGPGTTFDTLRMIRRLTSVGIPEAQAEALTEIIDSHFKGENDHTAVKLDTLKITRMLQKVGIPEEKAEVVKETIEQKQLAAVPTKIPVSIIVLNTVAIICSLVNPLAVGP
jgi:hypothetical protein